jgi:hypothetical protein
MWQPIETAPKDGTKVLAYIVANGVPYISVIWWRGEQFKDSMWKWRNALTDSATGGFADTLPNPGPTHWMPLPAPPKHEG